MKKRTALAMLAVLGSAACAGESTGPTESDMGGDGILIGSGHYSNVTAQTTTVAGDSVNGTDSSGGESRGAYIGAGF